MFPPDQPTNPTWNVTFELSLGGFRSEGCLIVGSGGTVNGLSSSIGNGVGSIGMATISGLNARWLNTGQIRVGNGGGFGTLNVNSGGYVSSLFDNQGVPSAIGIGLSRTRRRKHIWPWLRDSYRGSIGRGFQWRRVQH